jgi:hypothetical protein
VLDADVGFLELCGEGNCGGLLYCRIRFWVYGISGKARGIREKFFGYWGRRGELCRYFFQSIPAGDICCRWVG